MCIKRQADQKHFIQWPRTYSFIQLIGLNTFGLFCQSRRHETHKGISSHEKAGEYLYNVKHELIHFTILKRNIFMNYAALLSWLTKDALIAVTPWWTHCKICIMENFTVLCDKKVLVRLLKTTSINFTLARI